MIIENLKAQHRKVNIARYTGATATVGGGAMVAVGLILLPFTIGGSTALLVGGAATATAGGSAIAAATIVDEIIKKLKVKDVQEKFDRGREQLESIHKQMKAINERINEIRQNCRDASMDDFNEVFGKILRLIGLLESVDPESGSTDTALITIPTSMVVSRMVQTPMIIDLTSIVTMSLGLAIGSQRNAIKKLEKIVEQLENEKEVIGSSFEEAFMER